MGNININLSSRENRQNYDKFDSDKGQGISDNNPPPIPIKGISLYNIRARKKLQSDAPDCVPYYDSIIKIVNSPEAFKMPDHMTQLDDVLYLGNLDNARDVNMLKENNITYIINTVENQDDDLCQTKSLYDDSFTYMGFDSEDKEEYPIMNHFEDVFSFIEDARKNNKRCLIHCMRGVNRSGVLAVTHIMVRNNLGPITATQLVYQKRGMLLTNPSFISQLLIYAQQNGYTELDKNNVLLP